MCQFILIYLSLYIYMGDHKGRNSNDKKLKLLTYKFYKSSGNAIVMNNNIHPFVCSVSAILFVQGRMYFVCKSKNVWMTNAQFRLAILLNCRSSQWRVWAFHSHTLRFSKKIILEDGTICRYDFQDYKIQKDFKEIVKMEVEFVFLTFRWTGSFKRIFKFNVFLINNYINFLIY